MSDNGTPLPKVTKPAGGIKDGNYAGMPQQDVDLLVACLKNAGGPIVFNLHGAAEQLGYKNPRSVTNRLGFMKEKYGIALSGTTKVAVEAVDDDEDDDAEETPVKPKTPKAKAATVVTKRKAPKTPASTVKKTPAAKAKAPAVKAPAQPVVKKSPAVKKRKFEEVEFPGLDLDDSARRSSSDDDDA